MKQGLYSNIAAKRKRIGTAPAEMGGVTTQGMEQ
jgi:hypothetical protein